MNGMIRTVVVVHPCLDWVVGTLETAEVSTLVGRGHGQSFAAARARRGHCDVTPVRDFNWGGMERSGRERLTLRKHPRRLKRASSMILGISLDVREEEMQPPGSVPL